MGIVARFSAAIALSVIVGGCSEEPAGTTPESICSRMLECELISIEEACVAEFEAWVQSGDCLADRTCEQIRAMDYREGCTIPCDEETEPACSDSVTITVCLDKPGVGLRLAEHDCRSCDPSLPWCLPGLSWSCRDSNPETGEPGAICWGE